MPVSKMGGRLLRIWRRWDVWHRNEGGDVWHAALGVVTAVVLVWLAVTFVNEFFAHGLAWVLNGMRYAAWSVVAVVLFVWISGLGLVWMALANAWSATGKKARRVLLPVATIPWAFTLMWWAQGFHSTWIPRTHLSLAEGRPIAVMAGLGFALVLFLGVLASLLLLSFAVVWLVLVLVRPSATRGQTWCVAMGRRTWARLTRQGESTGRTAS